MPKHVKEPTLTQYKSSRLYLLIIGVASVLIAGALYSTMPTTEAAFHRNPLTGALVVSVMIFIAYFWLNGTKDVAYTLYFHLRLKNRIKLPPVARITSEPLVLLLYCTYNDFNPDSLLKSIQQQYRNFRTVILDDSTNPAYKARIDAFARAHHIQVVRRSDNIGFKAGNLNNFLRNYEWPFLYDYFVILDSDEIIPCNFIRRSLDYFAANPFAGILQANHVATRNRNWFMKKMSIGVNSHWPVYQAVKERLGFMSLLGHGAMVSRVCYEAAGGFPHVVAEDICFTIEARLKGFLTLFALDIVCEEEFPPDYAAFEKRHNKWTQGNMEFIRKNTRKILFSNMTWFEKLDIILFTYSLPLTALFSVYVIINVVAFPLLGYNLQYPLWMLAPTAVFLVAPMLNDIIVYWNKMSKRDLLSYLGHTTLLFGSMFFVSLRASLKSMFGGSVFLVTPKDSARVTFWEAIWINRSKLLFGLVLMAVSIGLNQSIFPVLLIVVPTIFGMYLSVSHQRKKEVQEISA
jgi:cellulose synthase/poly-beta-1,6-N-acetylglucosamine synthase-like glycosyltransferase